MTKNEHHTQEKSISIGNLPTYLKLQRTKDRELTISGLA